ncbi:hypothetical protein [Nocardia sp. NPDC057353]|uniref:hypothetical protein n=1 Tax=Nocardia sp. NPDC057353 TaxID=3346104 RepID=UPI003634DDAE
MASLPSLLEASQLCDATAQVMRAIAYHDYQESTVADIGSYDAAHGSDAMPDPLLTAHRLTRFYLVGAGDFVYSLGKLLGLDHPMVASPGVLARSAAEYSSRCAYLSDVGDSPELRISKMFNLFREGFNDFGVNKSDADPDMVKLAVGINDWRSRQTLPKANLPNYTNLIHKLAPSIGRREYQYLSGIAHANAITLSEAVISAQMGNEHNADTAWRYALFATHCGVMAAFGVALLRGCDPAPVISCRAAYTHYELKYNQYLWDLSVERGFTLSEPRPT